MSDEDISHESQETPDSEGRFVFPMDAFIPLVLLAVSLIGFLGWQVSVTSDQRNSLENVKSQLEDAVARQDPEVTQSQQVQQGLEKIAQDLINLAATDGTAKAIAEKYVRSTQPPASPAPSP